ncbi:hypothetical protein LTT66_14720 [Nocardia gipuzkoensis]|uniref:hypothetical protein n=1 Tax=Nocardia gipuzkoensis TaxID=2749991 RepID=UPI001E431456|nr:hypothetical protein [Nocardia gipuzkoensis]UGT71284.1 hypothetical protein LTT66_14720 [Nocardia gipuzkoensis]
MNDATREVGSAVGIALMGSAFASYYTSALPVRDQLPSQAGHAVESSAAAGLHVAGLLGPQGTALAAAVRSAFIGGLSASLVAVSVILAVAGVVAMLRAPEVQHPPRYRWLFCRATTNNS